METASDDDADMEKRVAKQIRTPGTEHLYSRLTAAKNMAKATHDPEHTGARSTLPRGSGPRHEAMTTLT